MSKVTITLELTYPQVTAVMALLNTPSPESPTEPVANDLPSEVQCTDKNVPDLSEALTDTRKFKSMDGIKLNVNTKVTPTAGKKTKMPSFGRSQTQVDTYTESEANRVEALDEEAELKAMRKEEREAKKLLKDAEDAIKQDIKQAALDEVTAIKEATLEEEDTAPLKKPIWLL